MLEQFQRIGRFLIYLKYPALALVLYSLVVISIVLFKPVLLPGKDWLFPSLISLIWGCVLLLFPAIFKDIPNFSIKPSSLKQRIRRFFTLVGYYFFALVFFVMVVALILLTYKMLIVSFL